MGLQAPLGHPAVVEEALVGKEQVDLSEQLTGMVQGTDTEHFSKRQRMGFWTGVSSLCKVLAALVAAASGLTRSHDGFLDCSEDNLTELSFLSGLTGSITEAETLSLHKLLLLSLQELLTLSLQEFLTLSLHEFLTTGACDGACGGTLMGFDTGIKSSTVGFCCRDSSVFETTALFSFNTGDWSL